VDVNDGVNGLCVINKGLPDFQLYGDRFRTLALTLLRCVGRRTGTIHSGSLAPQTPGAQCFGKHAFEYSVFPHAGGWEEAKVWRQAHQHNVPLYVTQTGAHEGDLPAEMSFVEVEPAEMVVTAIKKAESEDKLVVRLYNTTDKTVSGKVTTDGAVAAEMMNMDEETKETLQVMENGSVELTVPGKKIITLAFDVPVRGPEQGKEKTSARASGGDYVNPN
jgi:alpha-mannosidase